jgi:hypothetical protein
LVIDGVVFRELQEVMQIITDNDKFGQTENNLLKRSIGDLRMYKLYSITKSCGGVAGECLTTGMDQYEAEKFDLEWEAKWRSSIGNKPDSGIGETIKMFESNKQ